MVKLQNQYKMIQTQIKQGNTGKKEEKNYTKDIQRMHEN